MTDYTNSGVLFKNDRKEHDNQPDYTGKINVDGTEKRLAAWIKSGQNGKYMSLKVSDAERRDERQQASGRRDDSGPGPRTEHQSASDLDDEIPF